MSKSIKLVGSFLLFSSFILLSMLNLGFRLTCSYTCCCGWLAIEFGLGLQAPPPLLIGVEVAGLEMDPRKSSPHDEDFTIPVEVAAELCLGGCGERVRWTEGGSEV